MYQLILEHYTLFKALHVISVICWMAGQLYLPRLFVYHIGVSHYSEADLMLQVMEKRLLYYIMHPSMMCSWLFGSILISIVGFKENSWLHYKLLLVIIMTISHISMSCYLKNFRLHRNKRSAMYFKIINEIPSLLMVAIIILAVMKPGL